MDTNISTQEELAQLYKVLGQATRIQILLTIGTKNVCVCHLEAYLGVRQAAISQHLMVLRESGIVIAERRGRNMYYRLANPALMAVIEETAKVMGISIQSLQTVCDKPVSPCPCPHCNPPYGLGDCREDNPPSTQTT